MAGEPAVSLKPGKEKAVLKRHPWIFSGAVARWPSGVEDGAVVRVNTHDGRFLARAYLNRRSQIALRVLSLQPDEPIDNAFWVGRVEAAVRTRSQIPGLADTEMFRIVYAEADGLPGLVVDRYGSWLAVQFLTLGMATRKAQMTAILAEHLEPEGIWERSDVDVRRKEGLPLEKGLLWGRPPPERLELQEYGLRFAVDIRTGHKTGFYLDQRENRQKAMRWFRTLGTGKLLNAFSYTGAFSVCALAAGLAHATHVDSSAGALEMASENVRLNGFDPETSTCAVTGDVFRVLREFRDAGRLFDAVVLDPPKLAAGKGQLQAASRGYKDLNLLAMQLLRDGGLLITFSCSGIVSPDLFQKILFGAALDAGRTVQILDWLHQGADHPVPLHFPEAHYLKGFVCRVC